MPSSHPIGLDLDDSGIDAPDPDPALLAAGNRALVERVAELEDVPRCDHPNNGA